MKSVLLIIGVLLLVGMANAANYVQVGYGDARTVDEIYYSTAEPGKTFLLVDITVANHGYESVNTNPNYFQVEVNNVRYDYDTATYSIPEMGLPKLDNADVGDGGQISGYLAFQIPDGATKFSLIFKARGADVRYDKTEAAIQ